MVNKSEFYNTYIIFPGHFTYGERLSL